MHRHNSEGEDIMSDYNMDSTVDFASDGVCLERREEPTIDVSKPDAETLFLLSIDGQSR